MTKLSRAELRRDGKRRSERVFRRWRGKHSKYIHCALLYNESIIWSPLKDKRKENDTSYHRAMQLEEGALSFLSILTPSAGPDFVSILLLYVEVGTLAVVLEPIISHDLLRNIALSFSPCQA